MVFQFRFVLHTCMIAQPWVVTPNWFFSKIEIDNNILSIRRYLFILFLFFLATNRVAWLRNICIIRSDNILLL